MFKNLCLSAAALIISLDLSATLPPYVTATSNQQKVADQLESIVNPDFFQNNILQKIAPLSEQQTQSVLSQMSGQQYTSIFLSSEIVNRQFLRRLYDPLRLQIANPISYTDEVYDMCSSQGVNAWAEGSGGRSFLDGNKNASGFKMSGYEVSIGAQKRLTPIWTLGFAGCYSMTHMDYNVGGNMKSNTVIGAAYALYCPANYYALANVTVGGATNDMHRRVNFTKKDLLTLNIPLPKPQASGDAPKPEDGADSKRKFEEELAIQSDPFLGTDFIVKSRPNLTMASIYAEAGFDWDLEKVLIQPFLGFEAYSFKRSCKVDHGHRALRLVYSDKQSTQAFSRLGVHLTTPENCYDLYCGVDLAWQYRLTPSNNSLKVRFPSYGSSYNLTGIPDERNSMFLGFAVWSEFVDGWTIYLEASGERWKRVSSYAFTGGLVFKW